MTFGNFGLSFKKPFYGYLYAQQIIHFCRKKNAYLPFNKKKNKINRIIIFNFVFCTWVGRGTIRIRWLTINTEFNVVSSIG